MSTAGTEKLGSLVKSYNRLEVEDYQRVYVWDADNIQNLWNDLVACADFPADRDHFFGTLILQSDSETGAGSAKVVDGQQRLTTTFLLVAALRDAVSQLTVTQLPAEGTKLPTDVLSEAWKFLTYENDTAKHRFVPNSLLRKIMSNSVMPAVPNQAPVPWGVAHTYQKPTELNKPFRKAIRFTRELVGKELLPYKTDLEKLQRANTLLIALLERFTVLKVITGSVDESLDIFLTLNSRGQELKSSDLARGEILKKLTLGQSDEKEIQKLHAENLEEWDDMGQLVLDHEVFLRHYLVSTADSQITKKMILKEVVSRLNPEKADGFTDLNRAYDFWNKLKNAAVNYGQIINPTCDPEPKLHLQLLENLMLSHRILFLNVIGSGIGKEDFAKVTRATFVLAYRWNLIGQNAQDLETKFRKLGRAFAKDKDASALVAALKQEAKELPEVSLKKWSTDRDSSAPGRSLLYMVYRALAGDGNVWPISEMHLEHVAPQAKTEHWCQVMFEKKDVDDDVWQELISGVGNLTLLDPKINIKVKNAPFSTKKVKYDESQIDIVRDLLDFEEWTQELIAERTKWLKAMFDIIWSVEESNGKVVSFGEWLEGAES